MIKLKMGAIIFVVVGFMFMFKKIQSQQTEIATKNTVINRYQTDIERYKLDSVHNVSSMVVAVQRIDDLKRSKDSTEVELLNTLEKLDISTKNLSELSQINSNVSMDFEVETQYETLVVHDTVHIYNDINYINDVDSIVREVEHYQNEWCDIVRVKLANETKANYSIKIDASFQRFVHFEYKNERNGKLNKDRNKFSAWFHRMIGVDTPTTKETFLTLNPYIHITGIHTTIIDGGSLKRKHKKLLNP